MTTKKIKKIARQLVKGKNSKTFYQKVLSGTSYNEALVSFYEEILSKHLIK